MRRRSTRSRSLRPEKRDEGAAAVEFALVLPVLVALLLGIIQFGWYFFVANSASAAAREGARRVVVGDCWNNLDSTKPPLDPDAFFDFVSAQAPTTTSATYLPADLDDEAVKVGAPVTIKVTADASIVDFIPGLPSTVSREFTARLEDKTPGSCS